MELTKKFNEIPQVFNCEIEYERHENEYVVSFMYKNKFETALVIGDGYHEMLVGKYVPECGLMIPDIQKAVEKIFVQSVKWPPNAERLQKRNNGLTDTIGNPDRGKSPAYF